MMGLLECLVEQLGQCGLKWLIEQIGPSGAIALFLIVRLALLDGTPVYARQHKGGLTLLQQSAIDQQHFLDLCELLGHPKPAEVDLRGLWFTFEKGVQTSDVGKGWADL